MQSIYLEQIRLRNPLIHNLTNIVAAQFSANGLLALGASPIMSANVEEMTELPALSQAVVINIGTLIGKELEAMLLAGETANRLGIPVVLDPVGVGASAYRREAVKRLLQAVRFAAIRANSAELAAIAGVPWQAKGVDAGTGEVSRLSDIVQSVASRYGCIAVMSGEVDIICDGTRLAKVHNGTPMFPKITASGCLLSAVCGAFLAVAEPSDYFQALVEACSAYALAGELAAIPLKNTQLGQFAVGLIDQLAAMDAQQLNQLGRVTYD